MPIVWSLCQSPANATYEPVSSETKPHHAAKAPTAQSDRSLFELAPQSLESRAAASSPGAAPLEQTAPAASMASPSPVRIAAQAEWVQATEQPLLRDDVLIEKPLKEPSLATMAPHLEGFFAGASEPADNLAIAVFSPHQALRSQTPSHSPANQPRETSQRPASQPAPDAVLPSAPRDPELGVIQVADPRRDPELGLLQLRNPLQDPELGILELRQFSPPPPPRPFLFVSAYVAASSSDNVFLVEDPVQGRFGDNFIRPGISIVAFPALGPQTNLLASIETNLLRYEEQSASSYDEIRLRAAIRHRFTDRVYGQIGFSSQMLFDEGYDDQFFTNNGIEVTIGRRDPLTPQLTLDTFYQGQAFFSDPNEFSNVLNSVGAYLGYRFAPRWDTGIGYRFTISDFTQQSRHETYQRITGQLRYSITPSVRVSLFGGLSYGRSSEARITFDDTFFGISFDATIQVF